MNLRHLALLSLLAAAAVLAAPARAGVTVDAAGNTATASIDLSGVTAELILTFDRPEGLTPANLGISARVLGAMDILELAARLPDASLVSLPSQLPLMVTVEPPVDGLFMENTVRVELHTELLPYTAGSNYRLFKAPLGGQFADITDEVAPGSVRTRGTTGGFSQFIVVADLRPTSTVMAQKFDAIDGRLGSVGGTLQASLQSKIDAVQAAVAAGQYADAIAMLDNFRAEVSANAGTELPNAWQASDRNNNVAGDLQALAATLRFSIGYLRDFGI